MDQELLQINEDSGLYIHDYEIINVNGCQMKMPKRPIIPNTYNYDDIDFTIKNENVHGKFSESINIIEGMCTEMQIAALEDVLFYFKYTAQQRNRDIAIRKMYQSCEQLVLTSIQHKFIPKYFKGRYLPEILYECKGGAYRPVIRELKKYAGDTSYNIWYESFNKRRFGDPCVDDEVFDQIVKKIQNDINILNESHV